ncbi:glycine-rich cell wall structural protein 1.8-like [Mauremys reevesii]|uniref:glycine-rich cell wall structural protein 1.8-like n=1 Tax=Mauremys reevesii TaxID=260615 RepID=UPI00193FAB09|nr:glycine-rich cell wall structural protein 1.8-like [Mauremys reevesii]
MELLQRHLPGLHRVLRGALDYVSSFSTYLLGEQAHPGAEDHGKRGETDSSDPPKGVSTGGYGEGDPEHYGEEAPGGQREDAGDPPLQVPPDARDPTPQGGHTVLRGSGARVGSVSDQDTPHPLWAWPGAVSLEPGCGEPAAPGGRAPPPSPSLSQEPGPAGGGRSIWQGAATEEGGLPGSRAQGGAHGTGHIWLEEQREPRGSPCLKAEEGGGTGGASPMEEGGLGGSNTQGGPGAGSRWPGEARGREGQGQGQGDLGRGSLWLGAHGGSRESGAPIGECEEGGGAREGSWPQGGAPGEGSGAPLLCLVPQLELPDGAQTPLPEPGVVSPLDVSAQRSRVLLRRKGSVRRAPSLRGQRPPGGAPPQPPQEPGPPGGFLPPQPQTPRRQLPGHAGFGLAHPNMMAELKFRLRRPPPPQ